MGESDGKLGGRGMVDKGRYVKTRQDSVKKTKDVMERFGGIHNTTVKMMHQVPPPPLFMLQGAT